MVPGAPTGLTAAAIGAMAINLSWTAPADNGGADITGYKIESSADSEATWTDLMADTASTDTAYRDTNVPEETERHYRVSAINSVGTGMASNVDNATSTAGNPLVDRYDAIGDGNGNGDGILDKAEVIDAINDYLFGEGDEAISKDDVIELINLYLFGP